MPAVRCPKCRHELFVMDALAAAAATEQPLALGRKEAAHELGVSTGTLDALARRTDHLRLPHVRLDGRILFPRHLLLRWLEEHAAEFMDTYPMGTEATVGRHSKKQAA